MADGDILLVGAGVAGLAAARRLTKAGRRVVMIEARDRIGGRVHTIRPEGFVHPVELGAEFVHGRSNALWPVIAEAGLATRPLEERHEVLRDGRETSFPDVRSALETMLSPEIHGHPDRRLADVLDERLLAGDEPTTLAAVKDYVEGFHAADIRRFGVHSLAQNEAAGDQDGEEPFIFPEGYDGVPQWLRAQCEPSLLDLRLSTTLTSLRWKPGEVAATVINSDGDSSEIVAAQAVVTLPLGVLKAAPGTRGAVTVDPVPHGWADALRSVESGPAHRIVLRFESAWWVREGEPSVSFVHGPASAFPVWWVAPTLDEPTLTGWCGGPRAASLAGRLPDVILQAAFDSLAVIFGSRARQETGRLRGSYHHDWVTDPLSFGAYSYGGVGARAARELLAKPVSGTLYLAGEAIAGDGRNATVHGALVSGTRAAELVLQPK